MMSIVSPGLPRFASIWPRHALDCEQLSFAIISSISATSVARSLKVPDIAVRSKTAAFFMQHRRALVEYAAGIVGSRAQAEELVQEAWFRLDDAVSKRVIHQPLAYLYRIVRNLALDGRDAAHREGSVVLPADLGDLAKSAEFSGPTPEGIALYKDELRLLLQAMDELPARTRIAFQMHRLGGFKLREIASHLNISLPLAHTLVADGLEHCKERLRWMDSKRIL
jgi:RNA polymerase sigma factor (sigma-70 family)